MMRARVIQYFLIVTFIMLAVYLRSWQLGSQLIADDEWHALNKLLSAGNYWSIFNSFGFADHCIPLTLLYAWLGNHGWLSELTMRAPLLLAGTSLVIVLPLFLRSKLTSIEYVIYTGLLALSPLLIYFSRTARPYALSTLLACVALLAFYQGWVSRRRAYYLFYVLLAPLVVWLQPITAPLMATPFLFFGISALNQLRVQHDFSGIKRLFLIGLPTLILLLMLVLPPVLNDYASLAAKSGVDFMSWFTVGAVLQLYAGSQWGAVTLIWFFLAVLGARELFRRESFFATYLALCALMSIVVVVISGGAWLHHPLVPARYLLPLLPWVLLCVAFGVAYVLRPYSKTFQSFGCAFLFVILLFSGPLHRQYTGINQFTGHMGYQFDYDWERNLYNRLWSELPTPSFFVELSKTPEHYTLVMTPWLLEWHYNSWYLQQIEHQQKVVGGFLNGICGGALFGEYARSESRVHLSNMVHVDDSLLSGDVADYLVYTHWDSADGRFDVFKDCPAALRKHFGEPVYQDGQIDVYGIGRGSRAKEDVGE